MGKSTKSFSRVNRQALVIFSALALTFIAQLVWWVIFQFAVIEKRYDDYLTFANERKAELVERFEPELAFGRSLLEPPPSIPHLEWLISIESAIEQSKIVEAVIYFDSAGLAEVAGEQTLSSFAIGSADGRVVVHMDYTLIKRTALAGNPKLSFYPPDDLYSPLDTSDFPLDSVQVASYLEERDSSIRMHLGEGGFFVALIIAGLALIYRALARSEESRKMQENFLMAVTHELKTPLASLKLSIQGLRRGKFDSTRAEKANQMVDVDIERLDSLITDLLDAGKDVRGRVANPPALNLSEFVSEYFNSRETEFAQRGVTLSGLNELASAPTVLIAGADLKRTLDIVIDNAIKFGGENPTIKISAHSGSRQAELRVRDSGVGLEPDEISRIFDRFYRVGSELTRSRPGVGLGLYLGRQIMRSYGGELQAESAGLNQGVTMVLSVPLAEKNS
jgi:signal transduction histidine kinase